MSLIHKSLDFLVLSKSSKRRGRLDGLDHNLLIDSIFIYLEADEIVRLRSVCKYFYYLTLHAAIWKRLLMRVKFPLPPLPPTARNSLQNLTSLEAEKLVTRAITLDRVFRAPEPSFIDDFEFDAHHEVKSMVLLPGGKFLVTSVSNEANTHHSVMVYAMDHPLGRAIPLSRNSTITSAYHLTAKYMTIQGKPGILIAFVYRDVKKQSYWGKLAKRRINISDLHPDADLDLHNKNIKLMHECRVIHIPLSTLEHLADPDKVKPGTHAWDRYLATQAESCRVLFEIRTSSKLGMPNLDEIGGAAFVAVVRHPHRITFKHLEKEEPMTEIWCNPAPVFQDRPHKIITMRVLGPQKQVLVIREINVLRETNYYPIYPIEIYDIPLHPKDSNPTKLLGVHPHPKEQISIHDHRLDPQNVHFTDHFTMPSDGSDNNEELGIDETGARKGKGKDASIQPELYPDAYLPRPISLFARTIAPNEGFIRVTFYPKKVLDNPWESTPSSSSQSPPNPFPAHTPQRRAMKRDKYIYGLSFDSQSLIWWNDAPVNEQYRILPGSYRSLLYTIPWDAITDSPRICGVYVYFDRECLLRSPPTPDDPDFPLQPGVNGPVGAGQGELREGRFEVVKQVGVSIHEQTRPKCTTWDEHTGRFCFARENDRFVYVMDFSKGPRDNIHGQRHPLNYNEPTQVLPLPSDWDGISFPYYQRRPIPSMSNFSIQDDDMSVDQASNLDEDDTQAQLPFANVAVPLLPQIPQYDHSSRARGVRESTASTDSHMEVDNVQRGVVEKGNDDDEDIPYFRLWEEPEPEARVEEEKPEEHVYLHFQMGVKEEEPNDDTSLLGMDVEQTNKEPNVPRYPGGENASQARTFQRKRNPETVLQPVASSSKLPPSTDNHSARGNQRRLGSSIKSLPEVDPLDTTRQMYAPEPPRAPTSEFQFQSQPRSHPPPAIQPEASPDFALGDDRDTYNERRRSTGKMPMNPSPPLLEDESPPRESPLEAFRRRERMMFLYGTPYFQSPCQLGHTHHEPSHRSRTPAQPQAGPSRRRPEPYPTFRPSPSPDIMTGEDYVDYYERKHRQSQDSQGFYQSGPEPNPARRCSPLCPGNHSNPLDDPRLASLLQAPPVNVDGSTPFGRNQTFAYPNMNERDPFHRRKLGAHASSMNHENERHAHRRKKATPEERRKRAYNEETKAKAYLISRYMKSTERVKFDVEDISSVESDSASWPEGSTTGTTTSSFEMHSSLGEGTSANGSFRDEHLGDGSSIGEGSSWGSLSSPNKDTGGNCLGLFGPGTKSKEPR